jgi:hypothetical protein
MRFEGPWLKVLAGSLTRIAQPPWVFVMPPAAAVVVAVAAGTPTPVVASVSIRDGTLAVQAGESRQLSGRQDAQGNELDVPIAWTSGKPAAISVDAAGRPAR